MKGRNRKLRAAHLPPARQAALMALGKVLHNGTDVQAALDAALAPATQAAKARASGNGGATSTRVTGTTAGNAPAGASSSSAMRHAEISRQDAALATELVYGYLRSEIRVSWLLRRFLKSPEKLPAEALLTLGVAAHEILHLERVPHYASVDWAVSHVRNRFGDGLGKLANAVLRNVARLGDDALAPDLYRAGLSDRREFLAVFHAAPRWLVDLWCDAYGDERAEELLHASRQAPAPAVRVNASRPGWQELRERLATEYSGSFCGHSGVMFPVGGFPSEIAGLERSGLLSRQGAASQEVLHALGPEAWNGPVWDACCGRGGKALALLECGVDVHLCSDTNAARLRGFRADAARLGITPPTLARASAAVPPLAGQWPGTILIDAPCSGLGTLSRRPDIKLRRTPNDLAGLAGLQGRILQAALSLLPSGGQVAYITCTLNPDENERQIDSLLMTAQEGGAGSFFVAARHVTAPDTPAREFFYGVLLRKE